MQKCSMEACTSACTMAVNALCARTQSPHYQQHCKCGHISCLRFANIGNHAALVAPDMILNQVCPCCALCIEEGRLWCRWQKLQLRETMTSRSLLALSTPRCGNLRSASSRPPMALVCCMQQSTSLGLLASVFLVRSYPSALQQLAA